MATFLLENTRPRIFSIGAVQLMPGVNQVTTEQWDAIKGNVFTQLALDEEHIKWVAGRGPEDKVKEVAKAGAYPLKASTVKEAVAIVKKTTSVPTLEGWLRAETRKEVTSAINAQLAEIRKVDKDKEEAKELAKIEAGK